MRFRGRVPVTPDCRVFCRSDRSPYGVNPSSCPARYRHDRRVRGDLWSGKLGRDRRWGGRQAGVGANMVGPATPSGDA